MTCNWQKVKLGDTGLMTSPLGLGSSYGISTADVERAFERGVNFFYWGSLRRRAFGRGIKNIARGHRDDMIVAVQTYSRLGMLMRPSLELALCRLGLDRADLLILGWWNQPPPERILDAARALREKGKVGHIMVSCHNRPTFERYIADPRYGAIMVRYNAAHTGAEREVFPHLTKRRPGVVAYTATRWGHLIDPRMTPAGERTPRGSDCYRFALTNPDVNVCLAGPSGSEQLDEAMAALDRGPMSDEELAWMRRVGQSVRGVSLKAKLSET